MTRCRPKSPNIAPRRPAAAAAGALFALALVLGGCSSRGVEALNVLRDIAAGPEASTLKEITPRPVRAAVSYRWEGTAQRADVYRPGGGERAAAGLVLIPGVAPAGKDDPRLVAFATTLARARFEVLVPDIPNLRAQRVTPADVDRIAGAAAHLAERRRGSGGPVGLAAVSYAVGPALLAARDPRIPGGVAFLVGVGGYYDLDAVVTFFTTGGYRERPGGPWRFMTPNAYGKWIFVASNVQRLSRAEDRRALAEMARRKLADLNASIADLAARLGPEGRAVYALLANRDPERVPRLIAALPAAMRRDMAALDPERHDLSALATRLILVHGRDDSIIPYTESVHLAAAVPAGRADLFVVDSLRHVSLGAMGLVDSVRLWRAVRRLLEERDRTAPRESARRE